MRHTLRQTLASPGGEPHTKRRLLGACIAPLVCAAFAAPAAAQQCSPSFPDVVAAMYAQTLELGGGSDGLRGWTGALEGGQTVKHMVASNVDWAGHRERFMTGTSQEKLTNLYRHLLAREPDDGAVGWISVGETQGWDVVIRGIMNDAEYTARFGDHIVPGDPVVAWDCTRATGLKVAHNPGVRDAGQGGASVSYTTPAYVSMDQPRSLTFTYHSGLADPRSQVQLNVLHASADAPNRVLMEVRNAEGAKETLTDGRQEVAFLVGQGASRVSAEFIEPRHPNRNVSYEAVVRRYWPDGRSDETRVPFRAANLDARGSEFGQGWVLEGLQRLYDQGDGVHITEGATGLWFAQKGAAAGADGKRHYSAPSGDFSSVMKDDTGAYHRSYPDGTRVRFRRDGRMLDATDRFGNVTRYDYDGAGRLVKVADPVGKETTLSYTTTGALAWVQDPAGRRVNTDANGKELWRFREPDSSVGLDLYFVDRGGRRVLDSYWTPTGSRGAGLHTAYTFGYDAHGRVASVTAPQVKVTEAGVGDSVPMRPVVKTRSLQMAILGTGALGSEVPRVRPENIRVEVTDARNNTTRLAVDPLAIPTRVEEPLGRVSSGTTDRHGRVLRSVSSSGNTVVVEYVGVELRKTIDEGTGAVVQMEYEPTFHQLTRASGTGTTEVVNTYDTADPQRKLLTSRNGPTGTSETRYTFDGRGRVLTIKDPEEHGTTYTYEGQAGSTFDNLRTVTTGSATPRTTTTVYDRFGRDSIRISPRNDTTQTEYDLLNRVKRTVDPAGGATVYGYMNGQLYQVTDPKQQTYSFHRDALGRLGSEVDPRGRWSYSYYDRAGNATYMKNRRGQVVTAGYNELGQRVWRDADGARTTWSYDPKGLWMEARNAESTNRIEFDVAGRARQALTTLGAVTYTQVITPDVMGRRTQMDLSFPGTARSIAYTYNTRGQLQTLRDVGGGTTTFGYNADGQEETRTLPNGLVVGRDYPSTHVTAGISYGEPTLNSRLEMGYHHNLNGQVDARRMADLASLDGSTEIVRRYEYDRRGWMKSFTDERVTAATTSTCSGASLFDEDNGTCVPARDGTTSTLGGHTYTYDAVGNRMDSGSQIEGNLMKGLDGYTLEYDEDGNLMRKVKPGYDDMRPVWNSLGQMVSAWRYQRGWAHYGYDALGRRVRRTAPDGTVVRYLYDGDDLLAELDGATGQTIREYTYYPGVDRPHSVRAAHSGAIYYYATDHPGNVVGLINAGQQLENEYRYVHFGEVQVVKENIPQPLRFAAREWDDIPGLYQIRARWYDPQSGRFVSEDPIGLAGGINPYVYGNNNPINLRDPSGLKPGEKVVELAGVTSSNSCPKGWVLGPDNKCVPGEDDSGTPTGTPTGAPPGQTGEKGGSGNGTRGTGTIPSTPAKPNPPRPCETPSVRELAGLDIIDALIPAAVEAFHSATEIRRGATRGRVFLGTGALSVSGEALLVLGRATVVGLLGAEIVNLAKINSELVQACF